MLNRVRRERRRRDLRRSSPENRSDKDPSSARWGSFMSDTIVLLHGSATGSSSWDPVAGSLVSSGASVFAPDTLGYGRSPAPTSSYGIDEEVAHLARLLDLQSVGTLHLVTHSLGSLIGLHLRRALGRRVTRMTLVDPVVVSILRESGEDAAYAEMEEQYQRFMSLSADHEAAAHFFVDHWSGPGAWDSMGKRARAVVTSLVPMEMTATRSDTAKLAWLAESPPPTTILVGGKTLVAPRAVARHLGPALQATTVVVPGAAHMIPITHPEAVVDAVRFGVWYRWGF
jgi:pimeloyl-ACP methyl ester carboxylesterase